MSNRNNRPSQHKGNRNSQSESFKKRPRTNEPNEIDERIIFGKNAVMEGLQSGRSIDRIMISKSNHVDGTLQKIVDLGKDLSVLVKFVDKEKLDQATGHSKHQGVVAYMAAHNYVELDVLFENALNKGEAPFFILLDGIEDPHNLGAIIRTANVVGAHGVIIPKNRAVSLTSTVAKTSAGAIEYTPVCKVTNLARTIEELQAKNVWITGADMDGKPMYDIDFKGAIGLVIGSEGKGLSRLVKDKCDFVANIPMKGDINSLNASVAAGVLMYEAMRQRI